MILAKTLMEKLPETCSKCQLFESVCKYDHCMYFDGLGTYCTSAVHEENCRTKGYCLSLEDFYINRFGKKLYSMFFENYTENLWGRHPSEISPEWGAQRVKGLSIRAVLKDIFGKAFNSKNRTVETSLIEEFAYPKLGPGQLWELTAEEIRKRGGNILMNARVVGILKDARFAVGQVFPQGEIRVLCLAGNGSQHEENRKELLHNDNK